MSTEAAEELRALADRIENEERFGGCVVFIPPEGVMRSLLLCDSSPTKRFFMEQAISLLNALNNEFQEEEKRARGYGFS